MKKILLLLLLFLLANSVQAKITILRSAPNDEIGTHDQPSDWSGEAGSDVAVRYTNPYYGSGNDTLYVLYLETITDNITNPIQWAIVDIFSKNIRI